MRTMTMPTPGHANESSSVARFSSQSQSSDLALKKYERIHCQALEPSVSAKASDPRPWAAYAPCLMGSNLIV